MSYMNFILTSIADALPLIAARALTDRTRECVVSA